MADTNTSPEQKEILAAKNLALVKSGTQLSDSVTLRKLPSCPRLGMGTKIQSAFCGNDNLARL